MEAIKRETSFREDALGKESQQNIGNMKAETGTLGLERIGRKRTEEMGESTGRGRCLNKIKDV